MWGPHKSNREGLSSRSHPNKIWWCCNRQQWTWYLDVNCLYHISARIIMGCGSVQRNFQCRPRFLRAITVNHTRRQGYFNGVEVINKVGLVIFVCPKEDAELVWLVIEKHGDCWKNSVAIISEYFSHKKCQKSNKCKGLVKKNPFTNYLSESLMRIDHICLLGHILILTFE